jgi:NADH/F420H2 dehydrogenase subunit C
MNRESLESMIKELFPEATAEGDQEWPVILVQSDKLKETASALRFHENLAMDFLFCLTCVDWKTHFQLVYHLRSTQFAHIMVVKTKLEREDPRIETVSDIWRTAEFHEREVYDLFGVRFLNHPDLRRLFMSDDWKGWPLRKDYEDPVNMIRL